MFHSLDSCEIHGYVITGPPNGPALFCWLVSCYLSSSSVVVCNATGGLASRRARVRSAAAGPGMWAIGQPTLHGGPVRLRPVRATPCVMLWYLPTDFLSLDDLRNPVMSHFSDVSVITLNMFYINSSHHPNTLAIISVPVNTASPSLLSL